MIELKIILASTRPGRKGPAVAKWFHELAAKQAAFNTEFIDLAELNLPFMDEANHPRFKKYERQHTKDWSAKIDAADAIIIVTAEYNHSYPAPIKNALDFLYQEWNYKPIAFVSYGGVAGGTRAVQALKQVVIAQKMVPLADGVHIPSFTKRIDEAGNFNSDEHLDKSAIAVLDELNKLAVTLKQMRATK